LFLYPWNLFLLGLLLLGFATAKPRLWFRPLVITFWAFGLMLILAFRYKLPHWVSLPILAFLVVVVIYESSDAPPENSRPAASRRRMIAVLGILILWIPHLITSWRQNQLYLQREKHFLHDLADLDLGPHRLFVNWVNGFEPCRIRAFGNIDILRGSSIYQVGAFQSTPHARKVLERFGVKDPIRDIVDRTDVYIFRDELSWPLLKKYYLVRYGIDVEPIGPLGGPGCLAYRIVRWDRRGSRFQGEGSSWPPAKTISREALP